MPALPRQKGLSRAQERHFLDKGYVVLRGCLSRELASRWVEKGFARLGCSPSDPSTWRHGRVDLPAVTALGIKDSAPKAWAAICAIAGGEDRVREPEKASWSDSFMVEFPVAKGKPWKPPCAWRLEGRPEGVGALPRPGLDLLTRVIWSDIEPWGGGLFLACDSIGRVSRWFRDEPRRAVPLDAIVERCRDIVELTGRAGDVVLIHPWMICSDSRSFSGFPAFQTARSIGLREPLRRKGAKSGGSSLLERAIAEALARKLPAKPSREKREFVWPEPPRAPRRFQVYGIGLGRTGTASLAAIFDDYRSAHEFRREEALRARRDFAEGRIGRAKMKAYLRRRDEEGWLEMDSSHTHGPCVDLLVEEFPAAKFILLIRDFYSWFASEQGERLRRAQMPFALSERAFLSRFGEILESSLRQWTETNRFILSHVPASRLLIVRTQDLDASLEKIAAFTGAPLASLIAKNAHQNMTPTGQPDILSNVDGDLLERTVQARASELMRRFFPGYGFKDYRARYLQDRSAILP